MLVAPCLSGSCCRHNMMELGSFNVVSISVLNNIVCTIPQDCVLRPMLFTPCAASSYPFIKERVLQLHLDTDDTPMRLLLTENRRSVSEPNGCRFQKFCSLDAFRRPQLFPVKQNSLMLVILSRTLNYRFFYVVWFRLFSSNQSINQ
jgi:hypothetical protein